MVNWDLTKDEYKDVRAMDPDKRYIYSLEKIIEWGQFWSLSRCDIRMWGHDGKDIWLPFWPHKRFASDCAIKEWIDSNPVVSTLNLPSLKDWVALANRNEWLVGIFPLPPNITGDFFKVTPDMFLADLQGKMP